MGAQIDVLTVLGILQETLVTGLIEVTYDSPRIILSENLVIICAQI